MFDELTFDCFLACTLFVCSSLQIFEVHGSGLNFGLFLIPCVVLSAADSNVT